MKNTTLLPLTITLSFVALATLTLSSRVHAQSMVESAPAEPSSADDTTTPEPDTFEGDTPLELTVGVGSGASLGVGLVLAPEVSISLLGVGWLSVSGESHVFLQGTVGAAVDVAFLRPRVGEIVPIAQLYGGGTFGGLVSGPGVGVLGQMTPVAHVFLGGGASYVLDRHLALRGLVGPSAIIGVSSVSASFQGQLSLVYRA